MNANLLNSITAATVLAASAASGDVLSVFDFQNSWTGAKVNDFATFAANSPSGDADANSTTSLLSNSGFTGGGYASFSVKDSVVSATSAIFSTSATPDVGMNVGGANQTTPTRYFSFTVTPTAGYEITYANLTLYTDTSISGDQYDLQITASDGTGSPMDVGTHSYTPASANEPVHFVNFDFADFTSANVTEWRIYGYNTAAANNGIRFDDITLNGLTTVVAVPEPSAMALLGLGVALILRRKRQA